jgi:hypothetical protein
LLFRCSVVLLFCCLLSCCPVLASLLSQAVLLSAALEVGRSEVAVLKLP